MPRIDPSVRIDHLEADGHPITRQPGLQLLDMEEGQDEGSSRRIANGSKHRDSAARRLVAN